MTSPPTVLYGPSVRPSQHGFTHNLHTDLRYNLFENAGNEHQSPHFCAENRLFGSWHFSTQYSLEANLSVHTTTKRLEVTMCKQKGAAHTMHNVPSKPSDMSRDDLCNAAKKGSLVRENKGGNPCQTRSNHLHDCQ